MSDRLPGNYKEAVEYIEELPRFTRKHTMEHTREFLKRLGSPAKDRKIIHVAGTNGKGSVCAYMQAILEAEGKKTGFFTSPHLVKINERIQLDREPVSDEKFYQAFLKTLNVVKKMEEDGLSHPSYFEFLFGMGMSVFEESDAEYIILETGLGGRLDATNAPQKPFLTVITSISLDHTDILGDTIEMIAFEKAGIIKEGVPVFFDGSSQVASDVIRRIAEEKSAPCREITNRAFEIKEVNRNHIAFSRKSAYSKDTMWNVPGCGIYQVMNAEIAIQAMEYALAGEMIHIDRWSNAVASMKWEGRMELVAPHFTVDGAHNLGALSEFSKSIHAIYPDMR
ncbi:MAG: bifunctional folylpolyglutamate synthase/dihydrofolate synthase, partial [Oliverpabstia sp.]